MVVFNKLTYEQICKMIHATKAHIKRTEIVEEGEVVDTMKLKELTDELELLTARKSVLESGTPCTK